MFLLCICPRLVLLLMFPGALRNYGLVNVQVQKLGASHRRFNIEPQAILHIIRKLIAHDQYLQKTFNHFENGEYINLSSSESRPILLQVI